ncbi:GNAT family N-acetyltransferase [Bermanella marisrubri]|uniref:Spermidine n1-acetyltransferase n=1 Tax=Bermanella marisrubri TaxID=207949 RepID=Q1N5B2_9GAMM|nr:GNAT family N-acetyltransferase [Bermanella marisrubri]EAT13136.1 spermidine n1-acetyltransferase [Oceanobacter sp. RED65] [Bermanella marisrubri]QIZ83913.1 GNAT family N-acetyltransferase [Bermanella marisrubri]
MSYSEIESLIKAEQMRQKKSFIDTDDIDKYIFKIKSNAEFITHYTSGQCAGFIAFYCNEPTKKIAFITLVLLAPEFRGKGLASNLINYVIEHCKKNKFEKCSLEVRKDNLSAIKLYEKHGFKIKQDCDAKLLMSISF